MTEYTTSTMEDTHSGEVVEAHKGPALGTLLGPYRLDAVLGEGAAGTVYVAEHTRLGRKVALKLLHAELARDPRLANRFLDEARAVNRIRHQHVIDITDIVEQPEKYYIMELLVGETLSNLMARQGRLPLVRALDIATQLASALVAVDEEDIVHRDIKPENVFLVAKGGEGDFVKLIDFGIAQLPPSMRERNASEGLTGTPIYMSPEQAVGEPTDNRSDIYSFGVLLYELVTGQVPFAAKSLEEVRLQHLGAMPRPPSSLGLARAIPQDLEGLVLDCLAKTPEERPASMQEVEFRLHRIKSEQERLATEKKPPAKNRRKAALLIGLATLLLAGAVGVAVSSSTSTKDTPAPSRNERRTAQQASPAPPAATVNAQPEHVALSVESTPAGAVVRLEGEDEPLGKTPLHVQRAPEDRAAQVHIELSGYKPMTEAIRLDRDGALNVVLTPLPKPAAKPRPRVRRPVAPTRKSTPDEVKDPFAQ